MIQIGDLASRAGVSTRTIRYYEELGMIVPRERSNGGFRRYGEDQLRRLEIIQRLKALRFELERIRGLFCLRDMGARDERDRDPERLSLLRGETIRTQLQRLRRVPKQENVPDLIQCRRYDG